MIALAENRPPIADIAPGEPEILPEKHRRRDTFRHTEKRYAADMSCRRPVREDLARRSGTTGRPEVGVGFLRINHGGPDQARPEPSRTTTTRPIATAVEASSMSRRQSTGGRGEHPRAARAKPRTTRRPPSRSIADALRPRCRPGTMADISSSLRRSAGSAARTAARTTAPGCPPARQGRPEKAGSTAPGAARREASPHH